MSFHPSLSPLRRVALAGAAILFGAALAPAQTSHSNSSSAFDSSSAEPSISWSSSTDFAFPEASSAEPGTPAGASGGQYDNRKPRGGRQYTFEGGAGFNAPIGNDL